MHHTVDDIDENIEAATGFSDVRDLVVAWRSAAAAEGGVPERSSFLAGPAARHMPRLVHLVRDGETLRFVHVGELLLLLFGHDPKGLLLSEIDREGMRPFVWRYMAAIAGERPRLAVQRQIVLNSAGTHERLMLPVAFDGQRELIVYVRSHDDHSDMLRAVFNASTDSITVLDARRNAAGAIDDFIVRAANAESARRLNLQASELIGRTLLEYFPFAATNGTLARMIHAVETQNRDVFETRFMVGDTIAERELRLAPFGERLCVTNIDIGPQRTASRALERQRNELITANRLLACQAEDLRASNQRLEETARELRAEIERNHSLEAELTHSARYDGLTALPNRSYFERRFGEVIEEARRAGRIVGLCLIDLDHFKDINDRFGHGAGDSVLREVGHRLSEAIGASDVAGRLGGDEFGVLIIDPPDMATIKATIERIMTNVARPLVLARHELAISISAGVASFPNDATSEAELLVAADLATYRAKRVARGRSVFFEPNMLIEADRRTRLIQSLSRALQVGEIVPYFQPVMDLRTEQIVGFEALARWRHPTLGLLTPARFLEAFDERHLACAITETMIDRVTSELRDWSQTAVPAHVSINVTAFDLRGETFVADLQRHVHAKHLSPRQIAIEVTETTVLSHDGERIAATLSQLRGLGFSVALDDFGTGFASLSHLVSLPCDTIKIDRSFVTGLENSPRRAAVVRSMVSLAAALGLETVAEGIETRAELEAIRQLDCHLVQGYLVSEPLPAEAVQRFMETFMRPGGGRRSLRFG